MRHRLILLEGVPGSGKTTTARALTNRLRGWGVPARLWVEGQMDHPLDLFGYAYLGPGALDELARAYPGQGEGLALRSRTYGGHCLTPYRGLALPEGLERALAAREFCYTDRPQVPFAAFSEVFAQRFGAFARENAPSASVTVCESVLLQHQIHDLNRLYPALPREAALGHLQRLAAALAPLEPVLFYLAPSDVADSLARTAAQRGQPQWRARAGYLAQRAELERQALARLPLRAVTLADPARDRQAALGRMLGSLA